MRKLVASLLLVLVTLGAGFARPSVQRPLVSVVGEAEMSVAPDHVLFTLEIVTLDKDLAVAKRANDASAAKALAVVRAHQIPDRDVQTVNLTLTPKYSTPREGRGERVFIGFEMTKRIIVALRDLNRIESFIGNVLASGVNRVVDISFENSEIRKYREQVRAAAITNAQEKARAYAQRLGQSIGKAFSIIEEGAEGGAYGGGAGAGGGGYEIASGKGARTELVSSVPTFAMGQIKIEERIIVSFVLE